MIFQRIKQGLALSLVALLAACGSTTPTAVSPGGSGYLLTVQLEASDTQDSIAQRYGGEVIAWLGDKAILKMTDEAVAQMQARGVSMQNTTLDPNSAVAAPVTAAGWNAWGSGWNAWGSGWNAWGSGWNAWGSGWNAWSGGTGTIPVLPAENRHAWHRIGLPQNFANSKNFGAGVKVAVIDTGLDLNHPMFSGRLAPSAEWRDFVDGDATPQEVSGGTAYGHGTAAAGMILQVAPRATLLPIRVLNPNGMADVGLVAQAIDWAVQKGVRVINLSLGTNVDVSALKTIVDYATGLGVYVVASAGNEGSTSSITYPAAYATTGTGAKYLISVGSGNINSQLSTFSNRGTALEVVAPGEGVYSAYPGNQVAIVTGTSFAAPIVSGALALAASETAAANLPNLESPLKSCSWAMTGGGQQLNLNCMRQWLPDFQPWRKALFVVGSTTLGSGDQAAFNRMSSHLGYRVTVKTGAAAASADATGMDLVVISSTVNPTDVNTKFRNVAVPVMTWEAQLFDDLGMVSTATGSFGTSTGQTSIVKAVVDHSLGVGLPSGDTKTWGGNFSSSVTLSWGKPPSTAVRIASLPSDATRWVIFGYNTGTAMASLNAPARRVAFMFHDTTAATMSTTWWAEWMFDAAVTWSVTGN